MSLPVIDMGSSPDDLFTLRWNSFGKVLIQSTANLLHNGKFHDVTLACEGKTIRCHRFILALFSPCLAQMLEEHPSSDPVIYLGNGIRFSVLKTLVSYMYSGEVQIDQRGFTELLKAAEDLKIRGLSSTSSSKSKRLADSEGVMVNDDQGNFQGIDLTRNTEGAEVSFNLALTRTPSPSRSDVEQEQGPQNMIVREAKDGHGQETGLEEGGTGVRIDNEEGTGNASIPEVNDDNLHATSNIEGGWKPLDKGSRGGTENSSKNSRRRRRAVMKMLQEAKQSSSKSALESDKNAAEKKKAKKKKQRTLKLATQTSYYGGIMNQALGRVSGGEKISKVAIDMGIPISTLFKYVHHPEKLKTSRIYSYVPDSDKNVKNT